MIDPFTWWHIVALVYIMIGGAIVGSIRSWEPIPFYYVLFWPIFITIIFISILKDRRLKNGE